MDRGAWQATVHRVMKSRARLKWFSTLLRNRTSTSTKKIRDSGLLSNWLLCGFGNTLSSGVVRRVQDEGAAGLRESFVLWSCWTGLLWNVWNYVFRTGTIYLWDSLVPPLDTVRKNTIMYPEWVLGQTHVACERMTVTTDRTWVNEALALEDWLSPSGEQSEQKASLL